MLLGGFRLVLAMLSNPERAVGGTLLRRLAAFEMVSALMYNGLPLMSPVDGPLGP